MTGMTLSRIKALVMLSALALAGCGKGTPAPDDAPAASQSSKLDPRLHQPFTLATVSDLPDMIPPERTLTGKSVGKLYEQVVKMWDQVPLMSPHGKPLAYTAILETELGLIEIELWGELAPNHVRNFVALAKVGYYDGLVFERIIHQQADNDPSAKLEMIEGGCPAGNGGPNLGSIGYWLQPEFNDKVRHEEGTIGACRGEQPDSAACRFYITLTKAPVLDGERTVFGKVKRGLDVARRICSQPLLNAPEYPDPTRPEKPIVIRKVTIQVKEVENRLVSNNNN